MLEAGTEKPLEAEYFQKLTPGLACRSFSSSQATENLLGS